MHIVCGEKQLANQWADRGEGSGPEVSWFVARHIWEHNTGKYRGIREGFFCRHHTKLVIDLIPVERNI